MTDTLLEKFERGMDGCAPHLQENKRIAVAVSGGSDSVGLCHLLNVWCKQNGYFLKAYTVDHGLRKEAAEEAKLVETWCEELGIAHEILRGAGEAPSQGIQAYARDLRYSLLEKACASDDISDLFLGHQEEDQIETFLMRFSKGSGLTGLVSMRATSARGELNLHRPMLQIPRREIRDYLMGNSIDWIEDPSNEDPQYTRTSLGKIRAEISNLPGSDQSSLSQSIARLLRAELSIQEQVEGFLSRYVHMTSLGYAEIIKTDLEQASSEVSVRVLEKVLPFVAGRIGMERLSEIERLVERLQSGEQRSTLAGCQVMAQKDKILICREAGREGLPSVKMPLNGQLFWDHRFHIILNTQLSGNSDLFVEPIGQKSFKKLSEVIPKEIQNLPAVIKYNLPVLRKEGEIVAAPLICSEIEGSGIAKEGVEMVFNPEIVLN